MENLPRTNETVWMMKPKKSKPDNWAYLICHITIQTCVLIMVHQAMQEPVLTFPVIFIALGLFATWDGIVALHSEVDDDKKED